MPTTSHSLARSALRAPLAGVAATAVAALVACSDAAPPLDPADADTRHSAANATGPLVNSPPRPFRLTAEGNANPDFSQGPCAVLNTESGTGVALHLGRVSWTASEVGNFCIDPADPGLGTVSGEIVFTAANGDRLTANGQSTVQADFAGGTLTITGTFTITGGTGRFAGATGGGTITGGGSLLPPFAVATTFEGQISY